MALSVEHELAFPVIARTYRQVKRISAASFAGSGVWRWTDPTSAYGILNGRYAGRFT